MATPCGALVATWATIRPHARRQHGQAPRAGCPEQRPHRRGAVALPGSLADGLPSSSLGPRRVPGAPGPLRRRRSSASQVHYGHAPRVSNLVEEPCWGSPLHPSSVSWIPRLRVALREDRQYCKGKGEGERERERTPFGRASRAGRHEVPCQTFRLRATCRPYKPLICMLTWQPPLSRHPVFPPPFGMLCRNALIFLRGAYFTDALLTSTRWRISGAMSKHRLHKSTQIKASNTATGKIKPQPKETRA